MECPCLSQKKYDNVANLCIRVKRQKPPKSSCARYAAFVKNEIDYVISTHHPETRESVDHKEIEEWSKTLIERS